MVFSRRLNDLADNVLDITTLSRLHFGETKYEQDKLLIQIHSVMLHSSLARQKREGMVNELDSMEQNLGRGGTAGSMYGPLNMSQTRVVFMVYQNEEDYSLLPPASMNVIGAMFVLNKGIQQTFC